MEKYEKILELIDSHSRTLVGVLLKRIEVLEEQGVLTPKLYKSLVKENVYEQSRNLKKLIEVFIKVGKIEFKGREKD